MNPQMYEAMNLGGRVGDFYNKDGYVAYEYKSCEDTSSENSNFPSYTEVTKTVVTSEKWYYPGWLDFIKIKEDSYQVNLLALDDDNTPTMMVSYQFTDKHIANYIYLFVATRIIDKEVVHPKHKNRLMEVLTNIVSLPIKIQKSENNSLDIRSILPR